MFGIGIQELLIFLVSLCILLFISIRLDKKNIRPRGQKILTVFANFWVLFVFLIAILNIIQAYSERGDIMSAFSLFGLMTVLFSCGPGFAALALRGWLERRKR